MSETNSEPGSKGEASAETENGNKRSALGRIKRSREVTETRERIYSVLLTERYQHLVKLARDARKTFC